VAGGKLTTYRLMAQQTVDRIAGHLEVSLPECRTAQEPLLEPAQAVFSGVLPPPVTRQAVEHYCAHEWAMHLDDVMLRRTSWHYYKKDSSTVAAQTAEWMQEILGWDDTTREAELERFRQATK
jgi:glycerol-3-phosphate dehydrogenase